MRDAHCRLCRFNEGVKTVCMHGEYLDAATASTTTKHVMVVLDSPDGVADEAGSLLQTSTAQSIKAFANKAGFEDGQVYITSLIKCKPSRNITSKEVKACALYLREEILTVNPKIIITMGEKAAEALASVTTKHEGRGIGVRLNGTYARSVNSEGRGDVYVLPTYSPDMLRRQPWRSAEVLTDFVIAKKYIETEKRSVHYVRNNIRDFLYTTSQFPCHAIAFDIETDGNPEENGALDPLKGDPWLLAIAIMIENGSSQIYIFDRESFLRGEWDQVGRILSQLQGTTIYAHNGKFDLMWLRHHCLLGWQDVVLTHDTQIMHHLLNENATHKLAALQWRYAPQLINKGDIDFTTQRCRDLNQHQLQEYAAGDALSTLIIGEILHASLEAQGLVPLSKMLSEVSSTLADTEREGCCVDIARLNSLLADAEANALEHAQYIDEVAMQHGITEYNPNSPQQTLELLGILGFPEHVDEDGKASTDTDTLDAMVSMYETDVKYAKRIQSGGYAFIKYLLKYREWHYLAQSLTGIKERLTKDNKIRTTYFMTGTVTGRLSSRDPNLQNVPTRRKIGRQVKQVFIPSPGHLFVYADYSQMEYRVAAQMSGDEKMIELFNAGVDLHEATAQAIQALGSNVERSAAKNINFADLYGAGDQKVAAMSKLALSEVTVLRAKKRALFPQLTRWISSLPQQARSNGGRVSGLFRRVRRVPYATSTNKWWRSRADRQLVNSPIQGAASDITLAAIRQVSRSRFLVSSNVKFRVVLTVHDSIMWEIPEDVAELFAMHVKHQMEHLDLSEFGIELKVPLVADVEVLDRWGKIEDEVQTDDTEASTDRAAPVE